MARLGLDGSLNRRTGGAFETPTWGVVENVTDLSLEFDDGEADVTTRANGGWKAFLRALRDATITFDSVWDSADADLIALLTASIDKSSIDIACMDAPIDVANEGAIGFRMQCQVYMGTLAQPLAEGQKVTWRLRPTYAANPPYFVQVNDTGALEAFPITP